MMKKLFLACLLFAAPFSVTTANADAATAAIGYYSTSCGSAPPPCFIQYGASVPTTNTPTGTQDTNLKQVNGATVNVGTGAAGTGTQRVTTSTDSTIGTVTAVTTITNALPAGTNLVGKVGIDQTTPGTTNGVQVNAALPAGTNVIGHVIVDTAPSTAVTNAGTFATQATQAGTWTMQPGNTANTTAWLASNNDGTNTQKVLAASTSPALTDKAAVVALSPNPAPVCTNRVAISQTTSTDILTLTNIGYICSIVLVSDTAQFVSLVEGTGSTCGTGGAALLGSTTVGSGMSLAVTGGFVAVAATPWLKMVASADHLCLLQSGSGRIGGVITYQDHS